MNILRNSIEEALREGTIQLPEDSGLSQEDWISQKIEEVQEKGMVALTFNATSLGYVGTYGLRKDSILEVIQIILYNEREFKHNLLYAFTQSILQKLGNDIVTKKVTITCEDINYLSEKFPQHKEYIEKVFTKGV